VKRTINGREYNIKPGANLRCADLRRANLQWRDLRQAYLAGADLRDANLRGAYLTNADLRHANLRGADMTGADLRGADLTGADLTFAGLADSDLTGADLTSADLRGADLTGADLTSADLRGADMTGADLTKTCLDPSNSIPRVTDAEILGGGLEIGGDDWIYGWRTERSTEVGDTHYTPGEYTAPYFSTSDTKCHPGIYLASREWIGKKYPDRSIVRVRCRREDLHRTSNKWRCRKLEVLG